MNNRAFLILLVVLVLGVVLLLFQRQVEDTLAPELESVWVAIEARGATGDDAGLARVGTVHLPVGSDLRLHAVVGARRGDTPIYYTEAERLAFGDEEVPAEQIRPWSRSRPVKIRWYTVEGRWPYLPLEAESGARAFQMQEFLRSDWPLGWTVEGEIDAANDDHFAERSVLRSQIFGTQRYHVRFELYRLEDDLVPQEVLRSWGVDELRDTIERFPTAIVAPDDATAPIASLVGLTQLEPPPDADEAVFDQVRQLADAGLAFSRATALRDLLRSVERGLDDLTWRDVELGVDVLAWSGESAAGDLAPGDLVRVGDRIVVLYRDAEEAGTVGALDGADLCFDFEQGLSVRPLDAVFEGGVVELAALRSPSP
ncbi:MAG: hypothetical protein AAGC60_28570 [Acidobacteriota bacterium]